MTSDANDESHESSDEESPTEDNASAYEAFDALGSHTSLAGTNQCRSQSLESFPMSGPS